MVELFLEGAGLPDVPDLDREALAARLTEAHAQARAAWPRLQVHHFSSALGRHFGASQTPAALWFERLRPSDLYLATAVLQGTPGATEALLQQFRPDVARAARRFCGPRHPEDDLVQVVLEQVLVGAGDRPARLAAYGGQGFLQNWIRITAARLCIDAVKSGAQHRREEPRATLSMSDVSDLELDFLKATYRAHFRAAFAEAVAALEGHERTLLKLSYLHGLSIDALGGLFHVHRATAARRLERARQALLRHTRDALSQRLGTDEGELDQIMGLIHSRLEVSLERLLRTTLT